MSGKNFFLIVLVMVLTITGFVLGNAVSAAIGGAGDQSDPLVTKSYVDTEVSKLQNQIDSLKTEVEQLKSRTPQASPNN